MKSKRYWLWIAALLGAILYLLIMGLFFTGYPIPALCLLLGAWLADWNGRALHRYRQGQIPIDRLTAKLAAHDAQLRRVKKMIQSADHRHA